MRYQCRNLVIVCIILLRQIVILICFQEGCISIWIRIIFCYTEESKYSIVHLVFWFKAIIQNVRIVSFRNSSICRWHINSHFHITLSRSRSIVAPAIVHAGIFQRIATCCEHACRQHHC